MIEIANVTKKFGKRTVLQDINCKLEPGVIYGILGYNGAGKTSLLKVLSGLYKPDTGKVMFDGKNVFDDSQYKAQCFMVGDDQYFKPQSDIKRMCKYLSGYYPNWNQTVADKLLDIFNLPSDVKLEEFSKGMRRQSEILFALASSPKCLFLDESFDGLDWGKRELMVKVLKKYSKEKPAIIAVTSHYLRELQDIADKFILISDCSAHELTCDETAGFFMEDNREENRNFETLFT